MMVAYEGEGDAAKEAAHNAAMQVAALKAKYLKREDVPSDIVEKERSIAEQRQPLVRKASPKRPFRRSSKAASTASSRTLCFWSSPPSLITRRLLSS